jgi:hypothetical protein
MDTQDSFGRDSFRSETVSEGVGRQIPELVWSDRELVISRFWHAWAVTNP